MFTDLPSKNDPEQYPGKDKSSYQVMMLKNDDVTTVFMGTKASVPGFILFNEEKRLLSNL